LDFKTGAPRESDQRQLEIYVAAARALFPGSSVTGQLVYALGSRVELQCGRQQAARKTAP
jgi:hypothetical protein